MNESNRAYLRDNHGFVVKYANGRLTFRLSFVSTIDGENYLFESEIELYSLTEV